MYTAIEMQRWVGHELDEVLPLQVQHIHWVIHVAELGRGVLDPIEEAAVDVHETPGGDGHAEVASYVLKAFLRKHLTRDIEGSRSRPPEN